MDMARFADLEAGIGEVGAFDFARCIIGAGVAFFGHHEPVIVHLSVAVFIVEQAEGILASGQIRKTDFDGFAADFGDFLLVSTLRIIGKARLATKQGNAQFAFLIAQPLYLHRQ